MASLPEDIGQLFIKFVFTKEMLGEILAREICERFSQKFRPPAIRAHGISPPRVSKFMGKEPQRKIGSRTLEPFHHSRREKSGVTHQPQVSTMAAWVG